MTCLPTCERAGEFPPTVQAKLLRVLQEREFRRLGGGEVLRAEARVVVATHRDLEAMVAAGAFRLDLFYRINVFPIRLPPLRERRDDILPLANHFIARHAARLDKAIRRISSPAIDMLISYHWPGNVRELENALEHAAVLSDDGVIRGHHLPPTLRMPDGRERHAQESWEARLDALQREMLNDALKRSRGNCAAAARLIGTTSRVVRHQLRRLHIPWCEGGTG